MPSSRRDALLVSTQWLHAHLDDPNVRIIDIRGIIRPPQDPQPWYFAQRDAYTQSHIPGAVFVDWLVDIVDPDAPVKVTVARPQPFAQLMGRLGIDASHHIVIYDDDGGHIAARLWWILRYYGHENACLLDGGWSKWRAEGHPTSSSPPDHPQTTFNATRHPAWHTDQEEVKRAVDTQHACLLDCRGPSMYHGESTRGARKGHIPTARNLPYSAFIEGPHKTWKSNDAIQALFDQAQIPLDGRIITYCNAGVSASVGIFALHLLDHTNCANYDGSWYEWEASADNPTS